MGKPGGRLFIGKESLLLVLLANSYITPKKSLGLLLDWPILSLSKTHSFTKSQKPLNKWILLSKYPFGVPKAAHGRWRENCWSFYQIQNNHV